MNPTTNLLAVNPTLAITWPRRALYRKDEKGGGSGAWHCYRAASRGLSKIFVI